MNLADFRTALDRRTGVAYDPAAATNDVNEALMAVSSEASWPWLQRTWSFTTSGASGYGVPFDASQIRYVTVDGDEYLRRDVIDFDTQPADRQWTVWAGQLILPASTGAAVVVRYHADEDRLVNDNDEPLLPDTYSGAVIENAAARIFDRAGAGDTRASYLTASFRVNGAKANYEGWLRRMRKAANLQAGPRAARVRPGSML